MDSFGFIAVQKQRAYQASICFLIKHTIIPALIINVANDYTRCKHILQCEESGIQTLMVYLVQDNLNYHSDLPDTSLCLQSHITHTPAILQILHCVYKATSPIRQVFFRYFIVFTKPHYPYARRSSDTSLCLQSHITHTPGVLQILHCVYKATLPICQAFFSGQFAEVKGRLYVLQLQGQGQG